MDGDSFTLDPGNPFRLDFTAWALRRRPDNIVDRFDGRAYGRVLVLDGRPSAVEVVQAGGPDDPRLSVRITGPMPREAATVALERLLGLRADLSGFYASVARDPRLARLAERYRGVRPPRFPGLFEALCNAIACQQITLTLGIRLLAKLVRRCGLAHGPFLAFPEPGAVLGLDPAELRAMGFSMNKARALAASARAVMDGGLDGLETLGDDVAVDRLRALRGVGLWTAEYVLLRGLGRTAVFPGEDAGVRNNLQRLLGLPAPPAFEEVRKTFAAWRPYAGLVYFHLLLGRLESQGFFSAEGA